MYGVLLLLPDYYQGMVLAVGESTLSAVKVFFQDKQIVCMTKCQLNRSSGVVRTEYCSADHAEVCLHYCS